jgi:hypothetical protein
MHSGTYKVGGWETKHLHVLAENDFKKWDQHEKIHRKNIAKLRNPEKSYKTQTSVIV